MGGQISGDTSPGGIGPLGPNARGIRALLDRSALGAACHDSFLINKTIHLQVGISLL